MTTITNDFVSSLQKKETVASKNTQESLGQASFLKLMTAQLKFQDPFDPVDNQAMVGQMAQFSQVAGISEMNASLKAIAGGFGTSRLSEAASFIGRSVLQDGDTAYSDANGRYGGEFTLNAPANNVSLEWLDTAGNVVHTQAMGQVPAGKIPFELLSEDEAGNPVNIGPLKVRVTGAAASTMSTWLPVTAVESSSNGAEALLVTPAGSISTSSAKRIA
ncbi:flagellar hook capping FlgD N-terminal domain-containing protein [Blastomonas sp. AAP53]|uniref:flagellar hook assembly protein FlgD n=1 Tax=Blastomonas sp. AAP53 TaxID=1248760 RepID=UPI0002E65EF1|nr:flagellar hook capping FlgD N-terminal domain-containing protein [Blastomonas sp. AAP53]